jgi:C-terminal processing protease CtpA/Prc
LVASTALNDKSASPPLPRAEAQQYAQELGRIIEQVRDKYVQPVARAELVTAALQGLYGTAQLQVPPTLHAEIVEASKEPHELQRLLARIRENLGNLESLRGPQALLASIQGMTQALDPFSVVLTGTELERSDNASAEQRSLGLEPLTDAAAVPLVIKTVVPGGPAQKAGLRPGDQITLVNGQTRSVESGSFKPTSQVASERAVQLGVYRPSTRASWNVTLKPEKFRAETVRGVMRLPDNSWDYFLDHERRIAHVRIGSLEHGTAADLARVLSELTDAGMRGLILDLRWSPIGYLPEATYIADLFIGGYILPRLVFPVPGNLLAVADLYLGGYPKNATVVYRDGGLEDHYPSAEPGFIDFPMVVLINGETSGGAELVAAVLQDNLRAKIAGQRSRGKGSVQTVLGPEDLQVKGLVPRAALKLSNGMIIRPSGRNLHRFANSRPADDWGVVPDPKLEFRVSADMGRQLRDWWQLQDLRPGTGNESLPLDDPVADPQRQGALQALIDLLKTSSRPGS